MQAMCTTLLLIVELHARGTAGGLCAMYLVGLGRVCKTVDGLLSLRMSSGIQIFEYSNIFCQRPNW